MSKNDELILKFETQQIDSFFDCLADILLKLSNNMLHTFPDFKKHFSKVMLCRYLSMNPKLLCYAEYLNKVQMTLTNEQFYHLAYTIIPKQNSAFIKYIKKQKKEKTKKEKEDKSYTTMNIFDL